MVEGTRTCCVPHSKVAGSNRVDVFGVDFMEITGFIDDNHTLERLFCDIVIFDSVMSKIIEDFQG